MRRSYRRLVRRYGHCVQDADSSFTQLSVCSNVLAPNPDQSMIVIMIRVTCRAVDNHLLSYVGEQGARGGLVGRRAVTGLSMWFLLIVRTHALKRYHLTNVGFYPCWSISGSFPLLVLTI